MSTPLDQDFDYAVMLKLNEGCKIYLAIDPINIRRSLDALAALVSDVIQQNPLSGHLFVFRNKAADKIKLLIWDRNGLAIDCKRLERGRFKFPKLKNFSHVTLTQQELDLLLDGIDVLKLKRFPELDFDDVT
ncbi:MAG: IS66 family insertion sequence element accessory protein TnpB [Gammaproteobacteria bacterium]|nr:IS66 family insertion sequence element accessory protein TnpB [Gammaproteobacteria bacterium]